MWSYVNDFFFVMYLCDCVCRLFVQLSFHLQLYSCILPYCGVWFKFKCMIKNSKIIIIMKQESKKDQNVPINVEIFEPCYWFIAFNHEIQSYNKGNELLVLFFFNWNWTIEIDLRLSGTNCCLCCSSTKFMDKKLNQAFNSNWIYTILFSRYIVTPKRKQKKNNQIYCIWVRFFL